VDPAGAATRVVTHAVWDNLTHEQRAERVKLALDRLLDGE
jgi:hypothetical protein